MVEPNSSLTAHLRPLAAGAPAVAAAFIGGEPALALADGIVMIGDPGAELPAARKMREIRAAPRARRGTVDRVTIHAARLLEKRKSVRG